MRVLIKGTQRKETRNSAQIGFEIYYLVSRDGSTLRKVQGVRGKPNIVKGSWECGCQVVSNLTALVTTL